MIFKELCDARHQARLSGDTVATNFLSTLIGDLQNKTANANKADPSDQAVIEMLLSYRKNLMITRDAVAQRDPSDPQEQLHSELAIIASYLPPQLTDDELTAMIPDLITKLGNKQGVIMQYMKANHFGQYDAASFSRLLGAALRT